MLPLEIVNIILTFRPPHPVAEILKPLIDRYQNYLNKNSNYLPCYDDIPDGYHYEKIFLNNNLNFILKNNNNDDELFKAFSFPTFRYFQYLLRKNILFTPTLLTLVDPQSNYIPYFYKNKNGILKYKLLENIDIV